MSTNKNDLIEKLYSSIGFIFGDFGTFKEKVINQDNGELIVKNVSDIEDLIYVGILKENKFNEYFNNYIKGKGVRNTLKFLNTFIRKYNIELSPDDITTITSHKGVASFLSGLDPDNNKIKNELVKSLLEDYSISKIDITVNDNSEFIEDSEKAYLKEISKIPILDTLEEKEKFQELDRIKAKKQKHEDLITELKNKISELEEKISDLSSDIVFAGEIQIEKQQEIDAINKYIVDDNKKIEILKKEIENLQKEEDIIKDRISQSTDESTEYSQELEEVESKISKTYEYLISLTDKVDNYKSTIEAISIEIQGYENFREEFIAQIQEIKETILNIESLIKENEVKVESINDEFKELRNFIASHNLRLVAKAAFYYKRKLGTNAMLGLLDLISEGNIGLIRSIDKFEIERKFKFSTYATHWIKQGITRCIYENSKTIKWPPHFHELSQKIEKFKTAYTSEYGHEPSDIEIIQGVDITEANLVAFKTAASVSASLELPVGEDKDSTLGEFIPDSCLSIEELIENKDRVIRFWDSIYEIENNPPHHDEKTIRQHKRYGYILRKRLGLAINENKEVYIKDPQTLEKVAEGLGITRERVRQLERKAILLMFRKDKDKLKEEVEIKPIDYSDAESKVHTFKQYSFSHNMYISLVSYNPVLGTAELRCEKCGYEWKEKIKNLGKECICGPCSLRIIRERQQQNEEVATEQKEPESVMYPIAKYMGVTPFELYYALIRLDPKEKDFIINKFNQIKTEYEQIRYNDLVEKIRQIIERDQPGSSRTRKDKK